MMPRKRFKCSICQTILPAWYPVPGEPNPPMMLNHLSLRHATDPRADLGAMRRQEEILPALLRIFEEVEDEGDGRAST
jgi:hypothetical protein